MIRHRIGRVSELLSRREDVSELRVIVEGGESVALNYERLTGRAGPGDLLLLNTTAIHLSLGSGGLHFVEFNFSRPPPPFRGRGHIMKLRYTPWQMRVLSCEERASGHRPRLDRFTGLAGMPVLIGELHSMVAPAAAVLKYYRPDCRIAYIMTDGTALPLAFSRIVARLKERGLLSGTVTSGHAFGGDFEAVNVYSALAACRELIGADAVIIAPGPGSVGTGSRLGFSGMEAGEQVNRVSALGGAPLLIPRLSFAERRRRHFGVSHHTLTALELAALAPARLVLPLMPRLRLCLRQLASRGLLLRHRLQVRPAPPLPAIMERLGLGLEAVESMGRRYDDDPSFFDAAAVSAVAALEMLEGNGEGREDSDGRDGKRSLGEDGFNRVPLPGKDRQSAPRSGAYARERGAGFARDSGAPRGCRYPGARRAAAPGAGKAVPPGGGRDPSGGAGGET
ncbi:MAG: DUF3866 family protein [Dethiobacteria bacterium]